MTMRMLNSSIKWMKSKKNVQYDGAITKEKEIYGYFREQYVPAACA